MPSREELLAKLEAIRENYARSLPGKVEECRAVFDELAASTWDVSRARDMQNKIHRLAGSGGTFGFKIVTNLARATEELLDTIHDENRAPHARELSELRALLEQLAAASRHQDAPGPQLGKREERLPDDHVLLLTENPAAHEPWIPTLQALGYAVAQPADSAALRRRLETQTPRALLLDQRCRNFAVDAQRLREIERDAGGEVPLLVLGPANDLPSRLFAVRIGGSHFFAEPIDAAAIADVLRERERDPLRVVVVEDDPLLGRQLCATFENAGLHAMLVERPETLIRTLLELDPDVLLIKTLLPDMTGVELAGVLRQHRRFAGLPIVFLGAAGHHTSLDGECLVPPLSGEQLVHPVVARARRARALRRMWTRDTLTGLLQPSSFRGRLAREVLWASRQGESFALVLFDIDSFRPYNERHGHLSGDRVLSRLGQLLRERFRRTDVLGRCGRIDFGLLAMGTDAATARGLADELRARFTAQDGPDATPDLQLSFSAGIATFPACADADALWEAAHRALYEAKRSGGGCTAVAG